MCFWNAFQRISSPVLILNSCPQCLTVTRLDVSRSGVQIELRLHKGTTKAERQRRNYFCRYYFARGLETCLFGELLRRRLNKSEVSRQFIQDFDTSWISVFRRISDIYHKCTIFTRPAVTRVIKTKLENALLDV